MHLSDIYSVAALPDALTVPRACVTESLRISTPIRPPPPVLSSCTPRDCRIRGKFQASELQHRHPFAPSRIPSSNSLLPPTTLYSTSLYVMSSCWEIIAWKSDWQQIRNSSTSTKSPVCYSCRGCVFLHALHRRRITVRKFFYCPFSFFSSHSIFLVMSVWNAMNFLLSLQHVESAERKFFVGIWRRTPFHSRESS